MLRLALAILLALWSTSSALTQNLAAGESCRTPGGNPGRCTLVLQCSFVHQLLKDVKTGRDNQYVMSFKCGAESGTKKPLVCCPELASSQQCGSLTMSDNIVGGEETELDEYPWVAALAYSNGRDSKFQCGGSLISDRYVVTAAHCFQSNSKWKLDFVRLGEWDLDASPDCKVDSAGELLCNELHQDFGVSKVIMHEEFSHNDRKKQNDIAILKLDGQAPTTRSIAPICVPTQEMVDGLDIERTRFDVAGWGLTEERIKSKRKLKVDLPGQDISSCIKAFRVDRSFFTDGQLCVGGEKGKDSCRGDSGGPLMVVMQNRWHLVGVVSFGSYYCGTKDVPAIYTRVGSYLGWVAGKIELESRGDLKSFEE
ncbi:CLIP domain-containing serine protease B15-like [Culex pipiens pallens]|uniref:CLIP domain-containing serine protease B15-like n=1 Tax=Culex pipiens pallens TaxID=42434 RepID=UPI0022AA2BAD|nr:CLIP domain-containing serine protease B15-like [Culex pipiens pallens]